MERRLLCPFKILQFSIWLIFLIQRATGLSCLHLMDRDNLSGFNCWRNDTSVLSFRTRLRRWSFLIRHNAGGSICTWGRCRCGGLLLWCIVCHRPRTRWCPPVGPIECKKTWLKVKAVRQKLQSSSSVDLCTEPVKSCFEFRIFTFFESHFWIPFFCPLLLFKTHFQFL